MESDAADSGSLETQSVCGSPTAGQLEAAEGIVDEASRDSQKDFSRTDPTLPACASPTSAVEAAVAPAEAAHSHDAVPLRPAAAVARLSSQTDRCQASTSPGTPSAGGGRNKRGGPTVPDSPSQPKMTAFFPANTPPTCKTGSQHGNLKRNDEDGNNGDSQPGAGTGSAGAGLARQATHSGAAQGSGSGAGGSAGTHLPVANTKLATLALLFKKTPRSHGLEESVQHSIPGSKSRRQLFTALYRAARGIADLTDADQIAAITKIVGPILDRIECYIIASQVMEEERSLGPRLRQFAREKILPGLLEVGFTEEMLSSIHVALEAAALSSPQLQGVPQLDGISAFSDSHIHAANETLPRFHGLAGMLQRSFEKCCLCGSTPFRHCQRGHLSACRNCLKKLGVPLSGGRCMCLAIAESLLPRVQKVYSMVALATVARRKALMLNRRDLDMAATLLVLAAALALKPVIDTLLDAVMQSITIQVQDGLRPSLTMEQIVVLHRLHPDVTDHLVQRIARLSGNQLRKHALYAAGAPRQAPTAVPTVMRIGYLAGTLDNARLARGALANSKGEQDTWLIVGVERCRNPSANNLVEQYFKNERLLELDGDNEQQARKVSELNLDLLVLIAFPDEGMEYILASGAAFKSLNWRGMSSSLTDLCDFTLTSRSSPGADSRHPDPRVIQVGFDQPIQATSIHSDGSAGSVNRGPSTVSREPAWGLNNDTFVVMFPGFLVQLDKVSLWTWMQLVAGLDGSVLVLTAEQASMKLIVEGWVKEYAQVHGPFATDRVLLLEWQGSEIHAARIRRTNLCVAPLNPMSLTFLAASVLSEAVGILVLEGRGSADVRACGLGALLIATNAEDFVLKGQQWATEWKSASAFLREQQDKCAGCFDTAQCSTTLNKIFRAVLGGETPVPFDEQLPVYEDDQKTRQAGIFETIGESRLGRVLFYQRSFERVLHYLEREGIKIRCVAGIGGGAYVLRAVLSRDYRGIKNVVVKIDRNLRSDTKLHNAGVLRDANFGRTMSKRMHGSMCWSGLVPKPIYVLHGGRSCVGHTQPDSMRRVLLFSIFEDVGGRFEDVLECLTTEWIRDGTVSNDLVLACQEIFLALWHAHRNGLIVGDITAQNIGQNTDGKAVFWDLGHAVCGPPKAGYAYGRPLGTTRLQRRTSTHYFAQAGQEHGINPLGDACLFKASGKDKTKTKFQFLTERDLDRGEQLSREKGRGLGRLGNGTFTNYDRKAAGERAGAVKENPNAPIDYTREEGEDVYQAQRTILKVFNPVDWENPDDWERRATAAAADPKQMLEFLKSGTRCKPQQPLLLSRFAKWFANGLGPGPRPTLIDLMTHLALTSPALPPDVEQAIERGEGFHFSGGIAGQLYPGIKESWREVYVPPASLQKEPDGTGGHLGLGVQLAFAALNGTFLSFYCGTKRSASHGLGAMDTFPTRYGISIRSVKQAEKFSIDGFVGRKLTMQWVIDHQATGAFMNAGDYRGGPASNVRLDRHNAWTDPATGIVWIPMYALCDIAAGDFLRWNYRPEDGEGGIYTFECSVQNTSN